MKCGSSRREGTARDRLETCGMELRLALDSYGLKGKRNLINYAQGLILKRELQVVCLYKVTLHADVYQLWTLPK